MGKRWWSLAASTLAAGLVWLSFADLGVAIPTLATDLHAGANAMAWANNAFSLTIGTCVVIAGRLDDALGRRRMLVVGLVVFAAGCVVAALAPDVVVLVLGRVVMGVGGALILPATLALIPPEFTGTAALTAFSVWQAVAWGGQSLAPAFGGIVTEGVGWRWLFWLMLPLTALSVAGLLAFTPESRDEDASGRLDYTGAATLAVAVFALLFALTQGPASGWLSPVILVSLLVAVVLAWVWLWWERRVPNPLFALRLFATRSYSGSLTANLVMNLVFAGLSYLLVQWLQVVLGYSAIEAGLLMLPATVGVFLTLPLGSRWEAASTARTPIVRGLPVLGLGTLGLAALGVVSPLVALSLGLLVVGLGLGIMSTPISDASVGEVPEDLAGMAAGGFKMSSMVGGSLGVALMVAVSDAFTSAFATRDLTAAGLGADQVGQVTSAMSGPSDYTAATAHLPGAVRAAAGHAVDAAFTSGTALTMAATAALVAVGYVAVRRIWPAPPAGASSAMSSPAGDSPGSSAPAGDSPTSTGTVGSTG